MDRQTEGRTDGPIDGPNQSWSMWLMFEISSFATLSEVETKVVKRLLKTLLYEACQREILRQFCCQTIKAIFKAVQSERTSHTFL